MLVDIEPTLGLLGRVYKPEDLWYRLEQGVFLTHLNSSSEHFPALSRWPEFGDDRNSYGVCDNIEQIKTHYPELVGSNRRFVVTMTEIRHEDQAEAWGWRWHKWGKYIGDHEPQHEYLADEVGIDRVFVFNILEVVEESDFTVTVSGSERDDGEAPFTYVVKAKDGRDASCKALDIHRAEHEPIRDDLCVESITAGVPSKDCGYTWNDRREYLERSSGIPG